MSYYHHLFEAYIDRTTRSVNCRFSTHDQVVRQCAAADRLQSKIFKGDTLVMVTVKNVNTEYWKDARKEADQA
jgi:hypothetical protein